MFVQSATFNGETLPNCWMYREDLMKGGKLHFVMGPEPNQNWGVDLPPPSMSTEEKM
jgi:putative alpha-1,2-mannosidase